MGSPKPTLQTLSFRWDFHPLPITTRPGHPRSPHSNSWFSSSCLSQQLCFPTEPLPPPGTKHQLAEVSLLSKSSTPTLLYSHSNHPGTLSNHRDCWYLYRNRTLKLFYSISSCSVGFDSFLLVVRINFYLCLDKMCEMYITQR